MGNEITVRINCTVDEFSEILKEKGFRVTEKSTYDDRYYIPTNIEIDKMTCRKILSKAVLLRDVTWSIPNKKMVKLTFKNKKFDNNGDIIEQSQINCEIKNLDDGMKILPALGYKEIMRIVENEVVYTKDELGIVIKDVVNGDNLIEVETVENNIELDTIEKIKKKIAELEIPVDTSDYFIKKAEIELEKIIKAKE